MSLFPLLLDMEEQIAEAHGYGYYPDLNRCPLFRRFHQIPRSHWQQLYRTGSGHQKTDAEHNLIPSMGKNGFQIKMNVQNFAPTEISVKLNENTIVIEARHEERPDEHGSVFRHFIRKYFIPKECEVEKVTSTLSSDGILTVKAPLKCPKHSSANERVIEIQQTGPANLSLPTNDADDSDAWTK